MRKCLLGTFRVGSRKSKGWNSRSQAHRICPQICYCCKIQRDTRGAKQRQATLSLVIAVDTARTRAKPCCAKLEAVWLNWHLKKQFDSKFESTAFICFRTFLLSKVMSPKFLRKMWKLVTSKFKFCKRVEEVICQVFKNYSSLLDLEQKLDKLRVVVRNEICALENSLKF